MTLTIHESRCAICGKFAKESDGLVCQKCIDKDPAALARYAWRKHEKARKQKAKK
jgi:hypothetical protein